MSRSIAGKRCHPVCSGWFRASRAGNRVVFDLLGLPPALGAGRSGTVRPGQAAEESTERVRLAPGRGTMPLDGPTAEPGQVIWEMSVHKIDGSTCIELSCSGGSVNSYCCVNIIAACLGKKCPYTVPPSTFGNEPPPGVPAQPVY